MQDFIFRDNLETLKTKPCFVSKRGEYSTQLWRTGYEPPHVELYHPVIASVYNNRAYGGGKEIPTARQYVNCQHCGIMLKQGGMGAHVRSLKCLANRAKLQAYLEGYVLTPIQYCNLTSPFARRYPTDLCLHRKVKGHISMQAFYEAWFAELWLTYAVDQPEEYSVACKLQSMTTGPLKAIGGQKLTTSVIYREKRPQQRPPATILPCFQQLAAAKRRNSKRGIQQALDNITLTRELVDNA